MFGVDSHRLFILVGVLVFAVLSGCSNPTPEPDPTAFEKDVVYVSIQVDAEFNPVDIARRDAGNDAQGLDTLMNELKRRGIRATIMATADFVDVYSTKFTKFHMDGNEIGLHGQTTFERLDNLTYDLQKVLLTQALEIVGGCTPCGLAWPVTGFRAQGFSQNEDTYRVINELGLTYNSTFQAGLTFAPGHDNDTVPYAIDGYNFWAVPITTVEYGESNERVYLCDISCGLAHRYTPEQYGQILTKAVDQAVLTRQPLVLIVHGWYTGDEGQSQYLPQFKAFLDNLQSRTDVRFVTTKKLVEFYQTGVLKAPVFKDLAVPEANQLIQAKTGDANFVILDVRTPAEFATGYIAGAINLDYQGGAFGDAITNLDRNKVYLVYCGVGGRSAKARAQMKGLGFTEVYLLADGITAWKNQGYPVTK